MTLPETIAFMIKAHEGQFDKNGIQYWKHPIRMVLAMGDDAPLAVQQTAILHDVIEDTPVTVRDLLSAGFSSEVVDAVWLLTRDARTTYADYIGAILASGNQMAISVKLADLADNLSPERRGGIKRSLVRRYEWAHATLMSGRLA